jgi:hypothetical protein
MPALLPFCGGDGDGDGDAKVGRFTGENRGVCLLLGGDWNSKGEGEEEEDAPCAIGVVAAVAVPARRLPIPPALGLAPGPGPGLWMCADLREPVELSCPASREGRRKWNGKRR